MQLGTDQIHYHSLFCVEVDDFEGGVVVEGGDCDDPAPELLQYLLIVDSRQPEVDLREVLPHLDADAVQVFVDVGLGGDEAEEDVFPEAIAFGAFEAEDEGAAVAVAGVFPDGFDALLEEVDVGAGGELGGSEKVLVVGPEGLDGGQVGDGFEAVLEAVLPLHEVLVPEGEGARQGERVAVHPRQIMTIKCHQQSLINQQRWIPRAGTASPSSTSSTAGANNSAGKDCYIYSNRNASPIADFTQESEQHRGVRNKQQHQTPVVTPEKRERKLKGKALSSQEGRAKLVANLGFDLGDRHLHKAHPQQPPKSQKSQAKLRLPAISKSSSHSSSLHMKPQSYQSSELHESGKSLKVQAGSKRSPPTSSQILSSFTKKMQLDKYALRHLEFLDRFERQLKANDLSHGRTPQRAEHF